MIDKIEMSLDDIIQSNRGKGGAKRGGAKRGGSTRGGQNRPQGTKPAGAVIKGRQRGGITRSKYTRVSWRAGILEKAIWRITNNGGYCDVIEKYGALAKNLSYTKID